MLPDLRARYGVRSLGVFGFFVRGEHRPDSDLELLVEFDDRPLSLLGFLRLENEISDALEPKLALPSCSSGKNVVQSWYELYGLYNSYRPYE